MLHRLRRKLCTAALHSAAVQAPVDLVAAGLQVLQAPEPDTKVAMTMQHVDAWQEAAELLGPHTLVQFGAACNGMPDVPARPGRPELVDPKEMPSAKQLGVSLPVLYAHALAHIELNAVDLYWDLVLRTASVGRPLPVQFYSDFLSVAKDESQHFSMLQGRMQELGHGYGDIPAHRGLWVQAQRTRNDFLARVGITPLVQEARGLDAGPRLVHRLKSLRDHRTAAIVQCIVDEEVRHVQVGLHWFSLLCAEAGLVPVQEFHRLVRAHVDTPLFGPFNEAARTLAGMGPQWYVPVSNAAEAAEAAEAAPCVATAR